MANTLSLTVSRLSSQYNISSNALSSSIQRLSSGKRFGEPKDGVAEFMRMQQIRQDRRGYDDIMRNLAKGTAILNVAEGAATNIVDSFKRLKEITDLYHSSTSTASEKKIYEHEFAYIVADINMVADSASFEGRKLIQADSIITTLTLDPNDFSKTLEIRYDAEQMPDTSGLAIDAGGTKESAMEALDEQMAKAMSYLAKTSGFIRSIQSQTELINSVIENGHAYESTIGGINDAEELSRMVTNEIRQQATLSMILHANAARQSILRLLG